MNKKELLAHLRKQKFPTRITEAFARVKREEFMPKSLEHFAYEDTALPLGEGATISQPSTIAFMLQLLELKENQKILEIGSGSGYVLALLSQLLKKEEIYGVEIIRLLAENSQRLLMKDEKIVILNKDGSNGLPEAAPFDRILLSAASGHIPYHLLEQLKSEGIIVAPVRASIFQIKKQNEKVTTQEFPGFAFVPLVKDQ